MSIKDRLAKKTADLTVPAVELLRTEPAAPTPAGAAASSDARVPRTGPGQMLAYRSHMQENNRQVEELRDRLGEFEGSLPTKLLEPQLVMPSRWANRHNSSFASASFLELKTEIASAQGNIQAIRVRPHPDRTGHYEIVFGHRRHRACLELGLPVLAVIAPMPDAELFAAMDRENRSRADLSPFEQGEMYRRALDEGLYPSLRQLVLNLGVDLGNASRAIAIARLPAEVLAAFESPTQIQYRWGQELLNALQKDPDGVVARATAIRFAVEALAPAMAMDRLVGRSQTLKPFVKELKAGAKIVGKITRKADGALTVAIKRGVVDDAMAAQLQAAMEAILKA
jgi:ParB family transcriptional regulator, chromosome partitioning protein